MRETDSRKRERQRQARGKMDAAEKITRENTRRAETAVNGRTSRARLQEYKHTTKTEKRRLDRLKRARRGNAGNIPENRPETRKNARGQNVQHYAQNNAGQFVQYVKSTLNVKILIDFTLNVCYHADSQERQTAGRPETWKRERRPKAWKSFKTRCTLTIKSLPVHVEKQAGKAL